MDSRANFEILPEIQKCLPALSKEELNHLTESIKADGVLTPLLVCQIKGMSGYYLLDGHNRHAIAKKLDCAAPVEDLNPVMEFDSIEDCIQWVIKNQLGRRNLSKEIFDVMIGKLYNTTKKERGANQHTSPKKRGGQNDPSSKPMKTAQKVAEQVGVSEKKVKRAAKKQKALEQTGLESSVMDGTIKEIDEAVLQEVESEIIAEPEKAPEIVQKVIDEAKANNGKVKSKAKSKAQPKAKSKEQAKEELNEELTVNVTTVPAPRERKLYLDNSELGSSLSCDPSKTMSTDSIEYLEICTIEEQMEYQGMISDAIWSWRLLIMDRFKGKKQYEMLMQGQKLAEATFNEAWSNEISYGFERVSR